MSVDTWGHPQREQISTGCPTSSEEPQHTTQTRPKRALIFRVRLPMCAASAVLAVLQAVAPVAHRRSVERALQSTIRSEHFQHRAQLLVRPPRAAMTTSARPHLRLPETAIPRSQRRGRHLACVAWPFQQCPQLHRRPPLRCTGAANGHI